MFYNSNRSEDFSPIAKFHLEQRENPQKKIPHPFFSNRTINCICTLDIEAAKPVEVIHDPGLIGVDKLAIEVPIYGPESDIAGFLSSLRNSEIGKWGKSATVQLDAQSDAKAFVQFLKNRWSVLIEFNPSRLYDPDGCTLVPVEGVSRIVERVIRDIFEYAGNALPYFAFNSEGDPDWDNWDEDWKAQILISRLDATRDFLIPEKRFSLDLYRDIRPRSAKATRITYGNGGYAELWEGVYAGRYGAVKFYDKYRKARKDKIPNLPPQGLKRFEYCAGRSELDVAHIHNLSMLDANRFNRLLKLAWKKSNLYARKPLQGAWAEMILSSGADHEELLTCIGALFCKENGISFDVSKEVQKKIRNLTSRAGIDLRRSLSQYGLKRVQLNLEKGQLNYLDWSKH